MTNAKEKIEKAAEALVKKHGVVNLTMSAVCTKAKVPTGSFVHYMGMSWSEYLAELRVLVEGESFKTIKRTRASRLDRYNQVLNVAIDIAKRIGYDKVKMSTVATGAGVSRTIVSNHLGTENQMRGTILRSAVRRDIPEIIAQGISNRDPIALDAPKKLRIKAVAIFKGAAKC